MLGCVLLLVECDFYAEIRSKDEFAYPLGLKNHDLGRSV